MCRKLFFVSCSNFSSFKRKIWNILMKGMHGRIDSAEGVVFRILSLDFLVRILNVLHQLGHNFCGVSFCVSTSVWKLKFTDFNCIWLISFCFSLRRMTPTLSQKRKWSDGWKFKHTTSLTSAPALKLWMLPFKLKGFAAFTRSMGGSSELGEGPPTSASSPGYAASLQRGKCPKHLLTFGN